ncbi:MAG TPA: hypothetical protein VEZ20_08710 [Allosphingosinicella sp.]|nr:hypothetical protein [Allosphingosinicella sp.]
MDDNLAIFLVTSVAIVMATIMFLANAWIRARHRLAAAGAGEKIAALGNENARLVGEVNRLGARLAVLERIATDPAERTAREIELLR